MNKNKLIFAVIGILLLIGLLFIATSLNSSTDSKKIKKDNGYFSIWILGDNNEIGSIVENFKKIYPEYSNTDIRIEVFSSYNDYSDALMSSIISDNSPDIFVLNNNEKDGLFTNQVIGIDPTIINPNDFRKKYKLVFSDDLILSTGEKDNKTEFLIGIPVGYETLGIFYNRRYVKDTELKSLSGLSNKIAELKKKKPNLVPIGIGNGSTVKYASDIITQFFMLDEGVKGIEDVVGKVLKEGLATYLFYGDINGYNAFNSRYVELTSLGQNSIDLFSRGDTFMVVGYPRLINEISKKGFSKNFLLATPFPHYFSGEGKTLVNYNYFVINKDTKNKGLANNFLSYLSTDIGAEDYLNQFSYYLPALISLESDKLDQKIDENYNVILNDFLSTEYDLSSFNKGIKNVYDMNIISILDNSSNYESAFDRFRNTILCKANKITTLEKLSESCE